jgi:hypothetical protein
MSSLVYSSTDNQSGPPATSGLLLTTSEITPRSRNRDREYCLVRKMESIPEEPKRNVSILYVWRPPRRGSVWGIIFFFFLEEVYYH